MPKDQIDLQIQGVTTSKGNVGPNGLSRQGGNRRHTHTSLALRKQDNLWLRYKQHTKPHKNFQAYGFAD